MIHAGFKPEAGGAFAFLTRAVGRVKNLQTSETLGSLLLSPAGHMDVRWHKNLILTAPSGLRFELKHTKIRP
jgi:hypothetical protein